MRLKLCTVSFIMHCIIYHPKEAKLKHNIPIECTKNNYLNKSEYSAL